MILDHIPTTRLPAVDARPSPIVARIRQVRPSRRAMLKGLFVSAAAAALVPLDWALTRREAAAAGPTSEFGTCAPTSYDEEASNWWPEDSPGAICYGGWRRGGYPCSGGYHREGRFSDRGEQYISTRTEDSCEGRNGWRWRGYRCSDGLTETIFDDGEKYTGITIAACALSGSEPSASPYEAPRSRGSSPPADGPPAEGPPADGPSEPSRPGGSGASGGVFGPDGLFG